MSLNVTSLSNLITYIVTLFVLSALWFVVSIFPLPPVPYPRPYPSLSICAVTFANILELTNIPSIIPAIKLAQFIFVYLFVIGDLSKSLYSSSSSFDYSNPSAALPNKHFQIWLLIKWSIATNLISLFP